MERCGDGNEVEKYGRDSKKDRNETNDYRKRIDMRRVRAATIRVGLQEERRKDRRRRITKRLWEQWKFNRDDA